MTLPRPSTLFYTLLRVLPPLPRLWWRGAQITQTQFLLGVVGIVRNSAGQILVCSHTYRRQPLGLPSGWMARAESPLQGLEREVREETGLAVRGERLLMVGVTPDRPKLEFVVAGSLVGGTFRPSGEVDGIQWCDPAAMPRLPSVQERILALAAEVPPGTVGSYTSPWIEERQG